MKYTHLSLEEREKLYALRERGKSFRQISQELNRSHTSLSREYRKYAKYGRPYLPCKADHKARLKTIKQRTKAALKNHLIFLYVREHLRQHWSPETIAGRLPLDHLGENICVETIYQYIYGKGKWFKLWQYLPKFHRKRRVKSGRRLRLKKLSRIPGAVSIEERPNRVNSRKQAGHFETDLMEGKRGNKTVLSATVERKTRFTLINKQPNKKARTKTKTMLKKLKLLESTAKANRPIVRSVTADNGSENAGHSMISRELKVKYWFCHAYASWEKGTVENTIGRIRNYLPKGVSLKYITHRQVQWLENQLNNTPRKCLGYLTPNEAMMKEVNKYKFKRYLLQNQESGALQVRM